MLSGLLLKLMQQLLRGLAIFVAIGAGVGAGPQIWTRVNVAATLPGRLWLLLVRAKGSAATTWLILIGFVVSSTKVSVDEVCALSKRGQAVLDATGVRVEVDAATSY